MATTSSSTGGVLTLELAGKTAGDDYDQFQVLGDIYLDDTSVLQLILLGSFDPQEGDQFDLLDFENAIGTFGSIDLPDLGEDLAWDDSQLYTDGILSVVAVPEPSTAATLGLGAWLLGRRRRQF